MRLPLQGLLFERSFNKRNAKGLNMVARNFQLEIPRRSNVCSKGLEGFTPGSEYYSTLVDAGRGEWQRQDFCLVCWEESSAKQESSKTSITYWKSKVPFKKTVELPPVDRSRDERALELLQQALRSDTEESQAESFVLALYLARRRLIYLRQELKQAGEPSLNFYEVAATEEILCVKKLDPSQLEISKIQQRLAEKLKG